MMDQKWRMFRAKHAISMSYDVIIPLRGPQRFPTYHVPSRFHCYGLNLRRVWAVCQPLLPPLLPPPPSPLNQARELKKGPGEMG